MKPLLGKVALVTGASCGVGKGIALSLGEPGAKVYITGRTVEEVEAVFKHINTENKRLDILVNNVWGGYEHFTDGTEFWNEKGFWTLPISRWDSMFQSGVRAHYISSVLAVPLLMQQEYALIVNLSFFAAQRNDKGVAYGVAKAASDHMVACMAEELQEHNVAAVSLYPGLVRTESVMKAAKHLDLSNSELPQFIGRAVVSLATDANIMKKSGCVFVAAELAQEYGFTDIDGEQPYPLTAQDV